MRVKSITASLLVSACLLPLLLASVPLRAQEIQLQENRPDRYTVQKGDTLWDIAGKFLKQPWRWPELWRMNRDQIKNPHWIYPGDVLVLTRVGDEWQLTLDRSVRLSPTVRVERLESQAIPSIPAQDIEPYLTRPLVTGPDGLPGAGKIVAGRDNRVVRGQGDIVYAVSVDEKAGSQWVLYRPGRVLRSYDSQEILGYEMRYLGTAQVQRFAEVSTLVITAAREEIIVGDLLVPAPREVLINYVPHAPDKVVEGRIIDLANDAHEVGRGYIVTLDRGAQDGLDIGSVLAVYHPGPVMPDPRPYGASDTLSTTTDRTKVLLPPTQYLNIPSERTGLVFVFRVFDRVAYAIVLNTTDPVFPGDIVRKP
ncbi:MAG TPA: LysM domain-containing protein [Casimicrobiaceae bacterium]|nr:LysM domain-containing protein [Casimicrobiaceae bacterium]